MKRKKILKEINVIQDEIEATENTIWEALDVQEKALYALGKSRRRLDQLRLTLEATEE